MKKLNERAVVTRLELVLWNHLQTQDLHITAYNLALVEEQFLIRTQLSPIQLYFPLRTNNMNLFSFLDPGLAENVVERMSRCALPTNIF